MSLRGRKRKQGPREPNGRPQRESVGEIMGVVFSQPHRRWLAGRQKLRGKADPRSDEKAENALGLLCLQGLISEALYESGKEYGRIVLRMRWSISSPRGEPVAMRLLKTYGDGRDPTPEEVERANKDYDDARYSVLSCPGIVRSQRIMRAVDAVVVRNLACDDVDLMKEGLVRLHNHFTALTKRAKSVVINGGSETSARHTRSERPAR